MKAKKRAAGILLPITSLPSEYGIGTLGQAAFDFVDFLKKAGQTYWQILPVGPTGYGDSPYQSFSTFAGNPYYIDLTALCEEGLLQEDDCKKADLYSQENRVDYEKQYFNRFPLLKKAYANFINAKGNEEPDYLSFVEENRFWLDDYALFMAIKNEHDGKSFYEWEKDIRSRKPEAIEKYRKTCAQDYGFYCFLQYYFTKQWSLLKTYANKNGIRIIGDIPIYVAPDSADTWSNPKLFLMDKDGKPTGVAGCPPDYFSATGQLWGNPLYDWEYHKKTGYAWWIARIRNCYKLFDVLRIDHFRGFEAYYNIPYGDETAEFGEWEKGPGYDLFEAIKKELGNQPVIAEDLGFLTPEVHKLLKKTGYPGMKILQFAFDPAGNSDYLLHNCGRNSVIYTGTHDNDTTMGAFASLSRKEKQFAKDYLGIKSVKDAAEVIIRNALNSGSDTAIIVMQDYLGLGSEARINTPSTLGNNWVWRMEKDSLDDKLAKKIRRSCFVAGRCDV